MNKDNIIIIFLGIIAGLFLFFVPSALFFPLIVVSIAYPVGILWIYAKEKETPGILVKIFSIGFILRLTICILLAYLSYVKNGHVFFLGADTYGYSFNANRIIAAWKESGYVPPSNSLLWMLQAGDLNYYYFIAYLYYFFGENPFLLLFTNCSVGALTIIIIYFLAREIFNNKVAIFSALFYCFWPSTFLWSTQNLKEAFTVFLITLILLNIIRLSKRITSIASWIAILVSFFILFKIRSTIAVLLSIATFFSLFFLTKIKFRYALLVFLISIILFTQNIFGVNLFFSKFVGLNSISSIFQAMSHAHHVRTVNAESAFLVNTDISTPFKFFFYLPSFIFYIFFAPFPWEAPKLSQLFSVFEMFIWLILIIFAGKGIILSLRYRISRAYLLVLFLFLGTILLFFEGNVGTLFRHRAITWPFWHIFISAGLFYEIEEKKSGLYAEKFPHG